MPKGHLIPTPITNVNGVATTVYRSPDQATGKVSSMPPVTLVQSPAPSDPVDVLMSLFDSDEERLEHSLRNATPEQLLDVEQAIIVARGREARKLSPKRNTDSLRSLVAEGAYTAVGKIAEHGDAAPNSASLKTFGRIEVAKDIAALIEQVIPGGVSVEQTIESYAQVPMHYLDAVRRGVEAAAHLDGNKEAKTRVASSMYSLTNMVNLNEFEYVEAFDRHWQDMPEGMKSNSFRSVMVALRNGSPLTGEAYTEIAAHLRASHIHELEDPQSSNRLLAGRTYLHNHRLMGGVEMYPDHVDEVLQWHRDGRGIGFDSDAFRDYLAGGTLKEGLL